MSVENSKACYIPLQHKKQKYKDKYSKLCKFSETILEDESILKIGQNIKYDFVILKYGDSYKNMDDTMLMSYVLRLATEDII